MCSDLSKCTMRQQIVMHVAVDAPCLDQNQVLVGLLLKKPERVQRTSDLGTQNN